MNAHPRASCPRALPRSALLCVMLASMLLVFASDASAQPKGNRLLSADVRSGDTGLQLIREDVLLACTSCQAMKICDAGTVFRYRGPLPGGYEFEATSGQFKGELFRLSDADLNPRTFAWTTDLPNRPVLEPASAQVLAGDNTDEHGVRALSYETEMTSTIPLAELDSIALEFAKTYEPPNLKKRTEFYIEGNWAIGLFQDDAGQHYLCELSTYRGKGDNGEFSKLIEAVLLYPVDRADKAVFIREDPDGWQRRVFWFYKNTLKLETELTDDDTVAALPKRSDRTTVQRFTKIQSD